MVMNGLILKLTFPCRSLMPLPSRGMYSEDILCLSYLPPRFLATGSFDGVIKVWIIESTRLGTWTNPPPFSIQSEAWKGIHYMHTYIYTCVGLYIVLYMLRIRMCMCVLQYICIRCVYVAKSSAFTGCVCIQYIRTYVHMYTIL